MRSRGPGRRAWIVLAAGAGLTLGVLGMAVAVRLLDLRGPIAGQLSSLSGRNVRVDGRSSLLLLPSPGLRLRDVAVGPSSGSSWLRTARVGRLDVGLSLWPLLEGRVELRRLRVADVEVTIVTASDTGPTDTGAGSQLLRSIEALDARNVRVVADDSKEDVAHLDELWLRHRPPGHRLVWRASGRVERARFALTGESDPAPSGTRERPLSVDGSLAGAGIHGTGTIAESDGLVSVALDLRARADSLRSLSALTDAGLPALGPLEARAQLTFSEGVVGVRNLDLRVGTRETAWLDATGHADDALALREYSFRLDFGCADARALRPWVRDPPDLGRVTGRATLHNHSGKTRVEEFTLEGGRKGVFEVDASGSFEHVEAVDGLDANVSLRAHDLALLGELVHRSFPPTTPAEISGRVVATVGRLETRNLQGRLGDTTLTGDVTGDFRPERPRLVAKLEVPTLHLRDLGITPDAGPQTANAPREAKPTPAAPTGLFSDDPLDLSPLALADGRLSAHVDRVVGVEGELLSDLTLRARLEDRTLSLGPVDLAYAGGSIALQGELDARPSPPTARLQGTAEGARLERILAEIDERKAYSGRLGGSVDLRSRGTTPRALARNLAGSVEVAVMDGTIAVEDAGLLTRDLMLAVRPAERRRKTEPMRCLLVGLEFDQGVGTAGPLLLDSQDVVVAGGGTLDLRTETLQLRLVPKPHRASFFSTAFAVDVTGALSAPVVKVDKASAVTNTGRAFLQRAATLTQTERAWRMLFRRGVASSPCARALDPGGW